MAVTHITDDRGHDSIARVESIGGGIISLSIGIGAKCDILLSRNEAASIARALLTEVAKGFKPTS